MYSRCAAEGSPQRPHEPIGGALDSTDEDGAVELPMNLLERYLKDDLDDRST